VSELVGDEGDQNIKADLNILWRVHAGHSSPATGPRSAQDSEKAVIAVIMASSSHKSTDSPMSSGFFERMGDSWETTSR
jgi:hypothetical protein